MTRPFRFAAQLASPRDGTTWPDVARKVEDLGYSTLFVADHVDADWAPLVAITVGAGATTTLNVGVLVLDNDFRHPVLLARELATLQVACGGRVECGLGAGWKRSDYDQLGLPFDPPGVRIDRLIEALDIIDDLWSAGSSTRAGAHYNVCDAQCVRLGDQPPPALIIGGGSERILTLAAQRAGIVGFNPTMAGGAVLPETAASATAERYDQRVGWVTRAARRGVDELEFLCLTFFVHVGSRAQVLADRSALRSTRLSLPRYLAELGADVLVESPAVLIGDTSEITDTLLERRERFGFTYWVVHEDELEAFAPVVGRLAGT